MMASRAARSLRFALSALLAGTVATTITTAALASTPSLVIEVDTGRVLHAERATDPWHPASVTKLMTAYVALDMARRGRVSLDQLLTVSAEAAAQPPSKMGFKPGMQLTLDNALKIIMVKSANDVAATIAEGLGGSVEGFADLMNATSRELGMRESRWFNPHGLPDERQQTSARDMAILGRALLRDFPEHRELFSISAIQFGRRVMANHNGLLGRYPGVDGMKTGFICSSGFNVVASAHRDGRRLITVVFGATRPKEREMKALDLFDRAFASGGGFGGLFGGGPTVDGLPASNLITPPDLRPVVCNRRAPVPAEEEQPDPLTAAAAGNSENAGVAGTVSSQALAFAGGLAPGAGWQTRELPPRAPLQPVLVWLGSDPAGAVVVAEEDTAVKRPKAKAVVAAPKPAVAPKVVMPKVAARPEPKVEPAPPAAEAQKTSAPKPAARVAKPAPKPAARTAAKPAAPAQTYTSTGNPSIVEDAKGARKPGVTPSLVLNPKSAQAVKQTGAQKKGDGKAKPKAGG